MYLGDIRVYLCMLVGKCDTNRRLRSEVPTFKERKMGQTASAELVELTEGVIGPPQNVSKESEQNESEMLPVRGALKLKETSAMPRKWEEPKVLVTPTKERARSIA